MHTAFGRANVVFFFSLTTLLVCGLGCALSYYTQTGPAAASLKDVAITNVRVNYPKPFRGAQRGMEYGLMEFDLKADLRPLWNWNTKQIYVSVVANFESASRTRNSHTIWNRIINATSVEEGKSLSNINQAIFWEMDQPLNEYHTRGRELMLLSAQRGDLHSVRKNGGSSENRTIELQLHFEVFPLIGATFYGSAPSSKTSFELDPNQPLYYRQN